MNSLLDRLYDALRSVKLAVVLLVLLSILAALGGILPQGDDPDVYAAKFPGLPTRIILALSLDEVFTSPLFILCAAVFAVNLTLCTFHRVLKQIALPWRARRHGPDILHIGLILLLVGGTWSARTATETLVTLSPGEETSLPGGELIRLADFRFERYPDGRPMLWSSKIDIDEAGETRVSGFDLRVNRPLRYAGYTLYQSGYGEYPILVLRRGPLGLPEPIEQGRKAATPDGFVLFMAVDPASQDRSTFVFLVEGSGGRKVVKAGLGGEVGPFVVSSRDTMFSSVIRVRRDPAFPMILAGLLLAAIGTFLTYILKLREQSA